MVNMREKPTKFLSKSYPRYREFFELVEIPNRLVKRQDSVPNAVLRLVVGQMLSGQAARTIYGRIVEKANNKGIDYPWMLQSNDLRQCGLSRSKCKTIKEFRKRYLNDTNSIDNWDKLTVHDLEKAVIDNWGMSYWTAGVLAIFHFGHEDVFPKGDGSLRKALSLIKRKYGGRQINPKHASPYRSYLAIALWNGLDAKYI